MTSPGLGNVLRYLRGAVAPVGAGVLGDAQLLDRFLSERDEAAFESLVRRHGPMVLGLARTVLNDPHAADDVFQATFLVLARKAHALRKRESLASWLYGVAHRIALNARVRAARRRKHERRVVPMPLSQRHTDDMSRDLRPLLVEELNRLPQKYRAPLVLCYLQGLTNEEAAEQLRWPSGTVKGRLARVREVLRGRLAKRGLALTATAFTAVLADNGVSAAVPGSLVTTTLRVAVPVALGDTSLGGLVGSAAELARQAIRETLVARVAAVTLAALALAAGGAGAFWLAQHTEPSAATAEPEPPPLGEPRLLAAFSEEQHYRGMPVPIALSADGKRLAVLARRDTEGDELFLQEIATGAKLGTVKIAEGFRTATGDGKTLALVYASDLPGETRAEIRDLASLKLVREWKDEKGSVQPDDAFLAGDTLLLVGGHAGEAMAPPPGVFGGGFPGLPAGGFPAGGFPGGFGGGFALFGFGQGASALGLYDLRGKDKPAVHPLAGEDTLVAGQVVGPAGKLSAILLLQRDDESRVEVLDLITGKRRKLADRVEATALAASADGKGVALQTAENAVQLWDMTADKAGALLGDGDTTIVCFALSPDGRILATAGSDRRVKLWDVRTGRLARQLVQSRVQRLLFSGDGRLLASASPEEVKVWELGR